MGNKKSNSGYVSIWIWKKYFSEFDLRYSKTLEDYKKNQSITTLKKFTHKPPKDLKDRAVVRVGERVYSRNYAKQIGKTAVITDTNRFITIKYDYNNKEQKFEKKYWIVGFPKGRPPFIGTQNFPPLCGRASETNSVIGVWFDNIESPKWVENVLRPSELKVSQNASIIKYSMTSDLNDNEEVVRYGILVEKPVITSEQSLWKEYYWDILDKCKKNKIDCVGIPWITDIFEISEDLEVDVAKIGIETVLRWMKVNEEYQMKVMFICTSVDQYNSYSDVITSLKHK